MESDIRAAAFLWLRERASMNFGVFTHEELVRGFSYLGQQITLKGMTGIWFPRGFTMPISVTTTLENPYQDGFDSEGFLDYRYRGTDPNHHDNKGLRLAFETRTPFVYFQGFKTGRYHAIWPIFIVNDYPNELRIRAARDPAYDSAEFGIPSLDLDPSNPNDSAYGVRRYLTAMTKRRLHQSAFREYVLDAYDRQCAMCRLQHSELLDAAHIIADSEDGGDPVVPNGLSLCKIHHAAFDQNILGITPEYRIKVRADVLEEIDGPMLRFGLQDLENQVLILPKRRAERPDPARLELRFKRFAS